MAYWDGYEASRLKTKELEIALLEDGSGCSLHCLRNVSLNPKSFRRRIHALVPASRVVDQGADMVTKRLEQSRRVSGRGPRQTRGRSSCLSSCLLAVLDTSLRITVRAAATDWLRGDFEVVRNTAQVDEAGGC